MTRAAAVCALVLWTARASAQSVTQRGFLEGTAFVYPQAAPNDDVRFVSEVLAREEVFFKPAPWIQFAGGLDFRASSHDHVEDSWRLDFSDRTLKRPRLSIRRLAATVTRGRFTLDMGKQVIRWGKTDIVTPTDRFAPRDFLNVVDNELLAVTGARGVIQADQETFEVVWLPRFTPSRVPLVDQRWAPLPPLARGIPIVDANAPLPDGSQTGLRWGHVGSAIEYSLSFFDGFNHLPNMDALTTINAEPAEPACSVCSAGSANSASIVVRRIYPSIRTYGVDAAVPTRWFTIKGEAAYFTSSSVDTDLSLRSAEGAKGDEYVLYVLQLERQTGEWVLVGGYAGEAVTARRAALTFAPDRGMTRSIVARASYTIDPNRSVAFESAVRQNGNGVYAKAEYSQARGQHWRATVTGIVIAGSEDDFLGQYHRNSHATVALRYSF
jgi:hypothetical protein